MLPFCIIPKAQKTEADSCCEIIGINATKGIITSRNTTTGKVQKFKTSPTAMGRVRMGDELTLQNGRITAVNGNGFDPVNGIISGQVSDLVPCCGIVSVQVNDVEPCCAMVTLKDMATGQMYSFKSLAGIGKTLKAGQPVILQNGYAMVQAGATASAAQKGWYAFKAGMDSAGYDVKENTKVKPNTSDAEKWVITPSGLKGATGTVSITLPENVEWRLDIKSSDDNALGTWDDKWNNKKTISLLPGNYNVLFTYIPLLGVPIQKGMNTRLKAGLLNVVSVGQWQIWNEEKTKAHVVYYKPSKIALPIGKYVISINGQFQSVEIKEGEVTEF